MTVLSALVPRADFPLLAANPSLHYLDSAATSQKPRAVLDAIVNDRREVWPVNVPNRGAIADLPDDMVVEVPGFVDRSGVTPLAQGHLPRQVSGLVKHLGEYQALTAEAAWHGTRHQAVQALASNPLVHSFHTAETLYDEMSAALRQYLPDRLLH